METCSHNVKVKFEKHEDAFQVELPCDEHFVNIVRYVAEHVVSRGIGKSQARAFGLFCSCTIAVFMLDVFCPCGVFCLLLSDNMF